MFICDECNKQFTNAKGLAMHFFRTKHRQNKPDPASESVIDKVRRETKDRIALLLKEEEILDSKIAYVETLREQCKQIQALRRYLEAALTNSQDHEMPRSGESEIMVGHFTPSGA